MAAPVVGSASILVADYWWYRARERMMRAVFGGLVEKGAQILDVGSADGPSAGWLDQAGLRYSVDLDPSGLSPGRSVCASALRLPFADGTFDVVSAFDVVEHFSDEQAILGELRRVLRPAGILLASVPAYQWAWSAWDVRSGHYRRYTRRRFTRALEKHGFRVRRATCTFAITLPVFALSRLALRVRRPSPAEITVPVLPPWLDRLLGRLGAAEVYLLRRVDLPIGSSIFVAAENGGGPVDRLDGRDTH